MKLKFRPSIDSTAENNTPASKEETQGMGKGMLVVSMLIILAMLTFFFQGALEKQVNPNQKVNSHQNQQGQIVVKLKRNRAGHYVANGTINSKKVTFLLDTGATQVAIPEVTAKHLGLRYGNAIQLSTANGRATGYLTKIDHLTIGKISLHNVRGVITPNLNDILLGMSALRQLEFSQKGDVLTIKQ